MSQKKIIETATRLSESQIWKLQQAFYCQQGPEAWRKTIVPCYATSNPYVVRQYAQLTAGYIRDCLTQGQIDLTEPFYIFDLGAGSGNCAYLFLKEVLKLLRVPLLQEVRLRYVMTDITEKNLLYLAKHPYLKPYFKSGILDVAYYEANFKEEPIHLFLTKIPVDQKVVNPILLLCNYFFDTLPQDLFRVQKGKLEEGRISLSVDSEAPIQNSLDPRIIPHLQVEYSYHPIENLNYYPNDPELNAILKDYTKELDNQFFLLPIGGLHAMRYFSRLSKNRLLALVGDHGPCSLEQLIHQSDRLMTKHGNFSMTVNFNAISRYFQSLEGTVLLPTAPDPFFITGAFLLGLKESQEIHLAYKESVDYFQMRDYWNLIAHAKENWQESTVEQILLLIKFGNWDPLVFQLFLDAIRAKVLEISDREKETLSRVIDCIWDHFYPTSEEQGMFANTLGELFISMERYPQAIRYFQHSLAITGFKPGTYLNMGAAYLALDDKKSAWSCYQLAQMGVEDG